MDERKDGRRKEGYEAGRGQGFFKHKMENGE